MTERAATRAAFAFILITVMFDFLAFGIIAPVLPNLIAQFEGGDLARATKILGYFAFWWSTMQFFFSPILGAWSDRFGRRPIILISCLVFAFALNLFGGYAATGAPDQARMARLT